MMLFPTLISVFGLAVLGPVSLCLAQVTPLGQSVTLDGVYYYVPPTAVVSVDTTLARGQSGLVPFTVVNSSSDLTATINYYGSYDDVWTEAFANLIYTSSKSAKARRNVFVHSKFQLRGRQVETQIFQGTVELANGPYFLNSASGDVFQAYRLYSDFQQAFTETTFANPATGEISVLSAGIPGQELAVAVPSRLYYTPTPEKPLAGVRTGIKDIYDIKGLRSGDGNRAYYQFYPERNATAVPVQRLIDAGAIIVGKLVTSQFANGETATADWVDGLEPFNPRGDGYQDTSSSSAGPGAAAAAYSWLDLTVGSDTGGSIRGPSAVQGLFGNRPSHGLVSLENVMPLAPELDTAGFLTRDPYIWYTASKVIYDKLPTYSKFPKRIITLGFPTGPDDEDFGPGADVFVNFLAAVQKFLDAKVRAIDLDRRWTRRGPPNKPTDSLSDLLNITYPILISQEQTRLVGVKKKAMLIAQFRDPFYADYAAVHDGRRPFVNPTPLIRWAFGDSYPPETLQQAQKNMTIFADWFNSDVLKASPNSQTCTNKILFYPATQGGPSYRNRYRNPPGVPFGFSAGRISSFTSARDFVYPLGQFSYNSTITLHQEVLPVAVDVMVAKGCDSVIFELAQALVAEGIINVPLAGGTLTGGPILYRRDTHGLQ